MSWPRTRTSEEKRADSRILPGDLKTGLTFCQIPSIDELLATNAKPYPFQKIFENVKDDPVVVLHSSGSTGRSPPFFVLQIFLRSSTRLSKTNHNDPRHLRSRR